eukprot:jgi/Botrbrau1/16857/Bobra.150_2s0077.1
MGLGWASGPIGGPPIVFGAAKTPAQGPGGFGGAKTALGPGGFGGGFLPPKTPGEGLAGFGAGPLQMKAAAAGAPAFGAKAAHQGDPKPGEAPKEATPAAPAAGGWDVALLQQSKANQDKIQKAIEEEKEKAQGKAANPGLAQGAPPVFSFGVGAATFPSVPSASGTAANGPAAASPPIPIPGRLSQEVKLGGSAVTDSMMSISPPSRDQAKPPAFASGPAPAFFGQAPTSAPAPITGFAPLAAPAGGAQDAPSAAAPRPFGAPEAAFGSSKPAFTFGANPGAAATFSFGAHSDLPAAQQQPATTQAAFGSTLSAAPAAAAAAPLPGFGSSSHPNPFGPGPPTMSNFAASTLGTPAAFTSASATASAPLFHGFPTGAGGTAPAPTSVPAFGATAQTASGGGNNPQQVPFMFGANPGAAFGSGSAGIAASQPSGFGTTSSTPAFGAGTMLGSTTGGVFGSGAGQNPPSGLGTGVVNPFGQPNPLGQGQRPADAPGPSVPSLGGTIPLPGGAGPFGNLHTAPAFADGALRGGPLAGGTNGTPVPGSFVFGVGAAPGGPAMGPGGMTMGTAPDAAASRAKKYKVKKGLGTKRA